MPLDIALEKMQSSVKCIARTESVLLENALDRILSEDIVSPIMVPGYNNSAMDGYALRACDLQDTNTLELIGKSFAGAAFSGKLNTGQCVRIMTGAEMPSGTDTVVMQEKTAARDRTVTFLDTPKQGSNVRLAGNDIGCGDLLLQMGRRLSPTDIGLLASIGLAQVKVYCPIKVGLFSSGDELRLPGQPLQQGCIYDSNRFVIAAMLKRLGCEVLNLGIIADNPALLQQAFELACDQCDAVISSGGVSVGEADYTKEVLDELGEINFWKLAIKPGKPFAFGHIERQHKQTVFFGLPGNPVSATVTFHRLALPCLQIISGESLTESLTLTLPVNGALKKRPGRTDFQRGKLKITEQGLTADSSGTQSSGMLTSMSNSNCYIILENERSSVEAGEQVTVEPYDRWLS
tara:strand:- start:2462 stop:3676 length:1215 start_codon:yes stop_codon:yes gene_type:complete